MLHLTSRQKEVNMSVKQQLEKTPVPMQFLGPAPKGTYAPFGPIPERMLPLPERPVCLGTEAGLLANLLSAASCSCGCDGTVITAGFEPELRFDAGIWVLVLVLVVSADLL